jgi:hypothetical protein
LEAIRPAPGSPAGFGHVAELEDALDRALSDWRYRERWNDDWLAPAQRWSAAVWRCAAALGPAPIGPAQRAAGRRIVDAPILVCGAPRSGTTLLRDLLDGHPSLAVLPSEGKFFGPARGHAGAGRRSDASADGREWLQRLANPTHQQPFWLLGRSDPAGSPYVRFARAFLAWNDILADFDRARRIQPAVALALRAGEVAGLRHYVDKTPGYEFHLRSIWSQVPAAKVIQVVRDPAAVAASHAAGLRRTGLPAVSAARVLRNTAGSLVAGWRAARFAPEGQFLVVRYEDLCIRRAEAMAVVARFLGLEWHAGLMRPTIMGHPAEPNSSFHQAPRRAFEPAGLRERLWLELARACRRKSLASAGAEPAAEIAEVD